MSSVNAVDSQSIWAQWLAAQQSLQGAASASAGLSQQGSTGLASTSSLLQANSQDSVSLSSQALQALQTGGLSPSLLQQQGTQNLLTYGVQPHHHHHRHASASQQTPNATQTTAASQVPAVGQTESGSFQAKA